ncbi:unnamed protein product [Dracunculus medinensis]|uniref:Dynein_C domain-containing protein n=1 Tax=Dracunculus medinensis TaxID=318479 RepID=A0A0N4ULU3_DRAME|nr:unnamed protein product [Dracunculus medinensis]
MIRFFLVDEWVHYIRGLLSLVIYGGRIDNIYDSNVLNAYLNSFFNESVIQSSNFELCNILSFKKSSLNHLKDYISMIEKNIPQEDNPVLFGLPANIVSSWQMIQSGTMISQLKQMQLGSDRQPKFDRLVLCTTLSPILSIWKRLNSQTTFHSMQIPEVKDSDDPILEILSVEYIFAINLVQIIHSSLSNLNKCIKGTQLPTKSAIEMSHSLLMHQTPEHWQNHWDGPNDPVQYLSTVMSKVKATKELVSTAANGHIFSNPIKLTKLFRPEKLINALRQYIARKMKVGMDFLKLAAVWKTMKKENMNSVFLEITGIYIQGAHFDNRLCEVSSSSPPFSIIPNLLITWIPSETSSYYENSNSVFIPMYTTSNRDDLIAEIQIPCEGDPKKWQIASVALFLAVC